MACNISAPDLTAPQKHRVTTARRRKLEPLLLGRGAATQTGGVEDLAVPGSSYGSRLGTGAVEEDVESRLMALEFQHGLETPQPSRGPSRAPTAGSRLGTGRMSTAQSAARSMLGTPARPASHSQSAPNLVIELGPSLPVLSEISRGAMTRQLACRRSYGGTFLRDAPAWEKSNPVLPSRHRYLSSAIWGNILPSYEFREEETTTNTELPDHQIVGAPVKAFMKPRDKRTMYNEESLKFGNQQMMRKGGSSYPKINEYVKVKGA